MSSPDGWGRSQGREVYNRLIDFVESKPGVMIFHIALADVRRIDFSFASETLIELARRYRGNKGFCFIDPVDKDMLENLDAAAERKQQPLTVWNDGEYKIIGLQPTKGTITAFEFALKHKEARASEFVSTNPKISIANASMKFKQLWNQGFLLRTENVADSGGVEYVYHRIK
jgi:hypothetical protein